MKNLTLENITFACKGQYIGDAAQKTIEIKGAVIDSRQVEKDFLFIPIRGERVDGHDFIGAVIKQGAAAVLSEKRLENCIVPYILVNSTQQALKDLAAFYRRQLSIPIVGITGSVGKTSTKEMISSVLSTKLCVLKTAGNFNNEIGLPLTILRIREEHEAAVVEMGISDFGEMHRLGEIARPNICVITNIGVCHLEKLMDRDGVLKAKTEILEHLSEDAAVILNGDDDKLSTVVLPTYPQPLFYGLKKHGIFMDKVENLGLKGTRAVLHTPKGEIIVEIPIPGEHNLYNAMAATGVALQLGLSLEEIKQGIEKVQSIGGRSNLLEVNGMTVIDDCYNANPVSMKASIDVLKTALGRTIAVLGDMGELGELERQLHYEVGAYAAQKQIDILFCVGVLAEEMAAGAKRVGGNCKIYHFETKEEMLDTLLPVLRKGDTILVKASHFMDFPEIVKALEGEKYDSRK